MAMETLRIEKLSKHFGGLKVLNDISITVEVGERVAIIGPNGAGKTTLFNLLSGELPVSGGRIYFFGQDITNMHTHRRAHIGLSRLFQSIRLPFHLSVLDNVLLALHGMRASRYQMIRPITAYDEVLVKARERLESIGLWEKRDRPVKALSYGEQRKLGIALSLALEPKLLLLDEPSAGLDIAEVPTFTNMVKALTRDTTTIFAAHDMDLVFDLADRVLVLYFGRIIAQGTPSEIQLDPTVKEIYLGIEDNTANARTD
jgi:branched-chain amino acid transport system ATP-binding protein